MKNKGLRRAFTVAVSTAMMLISVVGGSTVAFAEESSDGYHIGLSMGSMSTEFCVMLAGEVEAAVEEAGDAELTVLSADGDGNTQVMNIDNFITMGVDAICVYPVDPEMCVDAMKRAREAGIYVVIVDQLPEDKDSFDIGVSVSMHDMGVAVDELASEWIDETFPDAEPGTVKAATLGVWYTEQFAERCDVFNELAEYNDKAKIVESYDIGVANFSTETAQDCEILLQKHPDINVIMCFTDSQAIIAEETIEKNADLLGLDMDTIGIFTVDHSVSSFELLERSINGDGCLEGITTTNINVGSILYECSMQQYDVDGLEDGKILYQDVIKITSENMEDYRDYIMKMKQ